MNELVLVTGGTGYVAGWCIARLLQRGYAVSTTVRSLSKADSVRTAGGRRPSSIRPTGSPSSSRI